MRCPSCHQDLRQTRGASGILWRCESCRHLAVGIDVLRNAVDKTCADEMWNTARSRSTFVDKKCPACEKYSVAINLDTRLFYACLLCDLLWLDDQTWASLPTDLPRRRFSGG